MNIDYNIKQLLNFQGKLDNWDVYLNELYKSILNSKKSSIRIVELNDRKDLIKCEGLEDNDISKELQTIYKVIDQERTIYNKLYNLVLNPKEYSFFSLKSTAKAKRDNEIKILFKQLFSINEEQKVRVNSLLKSLKLLQIDSSDSNVVAKEVFVQKAIIDASKKDSINQVAEVKKEMKPVVSKEEDANESDVDEVELEDEAERVLTSYEKEQEIDESLKSNDEDTQEEDLKPIDKQEEDEEFDYESEVKRLLGL